MSRHVVSLLIDVPTMVMSPGGDVEQLVATLLKTAPGGVPYGMTVKVLADVTLPGEQLSPGERLGNITRQIERLEAEYKWTPEMFNALLAGALQREMAGE